MSRTTKDSIGSPALAHETRPAILGAVLARVAVLAGVTRSLAKGRAGCGADPISRSGYREGYEGDQY